MSPMPMFARIFATTLPTFFMREKPTSSIANPACMNSTSIAATITHMVSTATAISWVVASLVTTGVSTANAAVGNAANSSRTIIDNKTNLRKDPSFSDQGYVQVEHSLRTMPLRGLWPDVQTYLRESATGLSRRYEEVGRFS